MPGKSGGLNGSTQHLDRTRLALETKAKSRSTVESTHWMVLHRPVEPARVTGDVEGNIQQQLRGPACSK
jgi:hypothetical protein